MIPSRMVSSRTNVLSSAMPMISAGIIIGRLSAPMIRSALRPGMRATARAASVPMITDNAPTARATIRLFCRAGQK